MIDEQTQEVSATVVSELLEYLEQSMLCPERGLGSRLKKVNGMYTYKELSNKTLKIRKEVFTEVHTALTDLIWKAGVNLHE